MPWLDLGALPSTYSPLKEEAFQVFMETQSQIPNTFIVKHSEWRDAYYSSKLRSLYDKFDFKDRGVTIEEVEDSLLRATQLVKNTRGLFTRLERMKNIACAILLFITVFLAVFAGMMTESIMWPVIIMVVYMICCYMAFLAVRYGASKKFRDAHFLLAIFCRSENNRFYLNHGMELRPGYLAHWIEVKVI